MNVPDLKIRKLYLAHPFPTRHRIREWELDFERRLGVTLTNPFYDRGRADVDKIDKGLLSPYDLKRHYKRIVEGDLRAIDEADGIVAFHRHGIPTLGTAMEIWHTAMTAKKPVFIATNKPGHPWLLYAAKASGGFIVSTLKQFEERLVAEFLGAEDGE